MRKKKWIYSFAGVLSKRRFRYAKKDGYTISTDADFVICGEIRSNETKPEGPHQALAISEGISTYKMHNGHRGINHPVLNLGTGKAEVTTITKHESTSFQCSK